MRAFRLLTVAVSWAGGGAALAAFPLLAAWNSTGDASEFEPGWFGSVACVAVAAAVFGLWISNVQGVRRPMLVGRYRGSDLVAALYPVSVVLPLTVLNAVDVLNSYSMPWVWLVLPNLFAAATGLIPLGFRRLADPTPWFQAAVWFWAAATVLLFPVVVGPVFVPLAVSNLLASQNDLLASADRVDVAS